MTDAALRAALASGSGVVSSMVARMGRVVSYGLFGLPSETAAGMPLEWPVLIGAVSTDTSSRIWVLSMVVGGGWQITDAMPTARIPWDRFRGAIDGPRNVPNGHIRPPDPALSIQELGLIG